MNQPENVGCAVWFDQSYAQSGFGAQRRYPNEELLRFLGHYYFALPPHARRAIRILEAGCGSGANLWMLAREGFDAHGIDLSREGAALCREVLAGWGSEAAVAVADMTAVPYDDRHFDVVLDVFSSYCLDERGFGRFLDEVARLLRGGGRFFSYAPSKGSDIFRDHAPSAMLDASTLDGIRRPGSPYFGNLYPFRFISSEEYEADLAGRGLRVVDSEIVSRSYGSRREHFEFVVIVAESER